MTIRVHYRDISGAETSREYKSVGGARLWVMRHLGGDARLEGDTAISRDGCGRARVEGVTLPVLFLRPMQFHRREN